MDDRTVSAAVVNVVVPSATKAVQPMHAWVLIMSAALGGFLFGYDTAIVNGGLFEMKRSFDISGTSWIAGFIVSSAIIGAVLGAFIGGVIANSHGRKRSLTIADMAFIAGSIIIAAAPNIPVVIVGRIVLGVGIGMASIVVPMYLAELTRPEIRGPAVTANNFCITGAQMLAAIVAVIFVYAENSDSSNPWGWRAMFGLAAIPAGLQLALVRRLPESPSWLALRGAPAVDVAWAAARAGIEMPTGGPLASRGGSLQYDESTHLLDGTAKPPSASDGQQQPGSTGDAGAASPAPSVSSICLQEVAANEATTTSSPAATPPPASATSDTVDPLDAALVPPASLLELFKTRSLHGRIAIGVSLQLFQQLCGINTVMYYSSTILQHAGYKGDRDPIVFSVPLAATNAFATLIAFYAVERHGRRPLMLVSLVGCAIFLAAFAAVAFAFPSDDPPHGAAIGFIFCLIGYLAMFAPGMGATPWVVNSEIYPLRFRSSATSVATMANWISNAAVSQLFPVVIGWIGIGGTFLVLVGMCVAAFACIWWILPETKGLSLEQLERGLPPVQRGGCPRLSA
jgi:MFS family permease